MVRQMGAGAGDRLQRGGAQRLDVVGAARARGAGDRHSDDGDDGDDDHAACLPRCRAHRWGWKKVCLGGGVFLSATASLRSFVLCTATLRVAGS